MRANRASLTRRRACEAREKKSLSAVSLSVFSLVPHLLFDCSRVLEYAKMRTVLQSTVLYSFYFMNFYHWEEARKIKRL